MCIHLLLFMYLHLDDVNCAFARVWFEHLFIFKTHKVDSAYQQPFYKYFACNTNYKICKQKKCSFFIRNIKCVSLEFSFDGEQTIRWIGFLKHSLCVSVWSMIGYGVAEIDLWFRYCSSGFIRSNLEFVSQISLFFFQLKITDQQLWSLFFPDVLLGS